MADIKIKRRILSACQTNCYYVFRDGSDEMVIIDPGDRGDIVYQDVKSLGCKKIAGILLTHGHGDHTGGALQLKELTGAKIYAYEEEAELLKDPEKNLSGWFGPAYGWEADEYFRDNQEFDMAGIHFKVLHTPGHTQGGVCYYIEEEKALFSGDTLFCQSVGRTDFPTGKSSTLIHSIQDKLMPLPDDTMVYTGHEDMTTIGMERKYNPFL